MSRIVLHPTHPRSVGEAFAAADDLPVSFPDLDAVDEAINDAEILVTYRWDDRWLGAGLGWIQSVSVGVDQFPVRALEAAGIVLTSARGCHGPQVSEHAFALLLAMTRGVGVATRHAAQRLWKPTSGVEIAGMTLGVLGLGTIGEEIARKGAAWGMRVIGTKSRPDSYEGVAEEVLGPDRTLEVFRLADVVISVLPDLPSTRGIVTRECLDALDGGWFVNVGRGSAVSERDLLAALEARTISGAGLDVFETEPLPVESPLWEHPRVVLTPHTAGLSPHYGPRLLDVFRANLAAFDGASGWRNRIV